MIAVAGRAARAVALSWLLLACPAVSLAQPADAQDEAQRLYLEGRQLLEAGDLAGALAKLEPSLSMQNSPNTELLVAHALRRLGKKPAAMVTYVRVVEHAGERVGKGETRYTATLDDAGRWVARLRAELAEVQVSLIGAPEGTQLVVDGAAVPTTRRGSDLFATVWREPGAVALKVATADGRSITREHSAVAAQKSSVRIDLAPAAAPGAATYTPMDPDVAPAPPESGGPPALTWIAGGVALAGFGTFAVFGALSLDNASEADGCAPTCRPSLTEEGQRNQTIANVALAVGAGAATVAVVAWIIDAASDPPDSNRRRGSRARRAATFQYRF